MSLETLSVFLFREIATLLFLLEGAKVVYYTLMYFDLFGVTCVGHAICRNRNPALTATTDFRFYALYLAGIFFAALFFYYRTVPRSFARTRALIRSV